MTTSAQVKKWLKAQGVEVKRTRSINGKRGGKTVTHYIEARSGSLSPIFPVEMREQMLKIVYGSDFVSRDGRWIAGNITPHMVSMHPLRWAALKEASE